LVNLGFIYLEMLEVILKFSLNKEILVDNVTCPKAGIEKCGLKRIQFTLPANSIIDIKEILVPVILEAYTDTCSEIISKAVADSGCESYRGNVAKAEAEAAAEDELILIETLLRLGFAMGVAVAAAIVGFLGCSSGYQCQAEG
jgi:hypothetical protein